MSKLLQLYGIKDRIMGRLEELEKILAIKENVRLSNEYDILHIKLEKINEKISYCEGKIIYKAYIN